MKKYLVMLGLSLGLMQSLAASSSTEIAAANTLISTIQTAGTATSEQITWLNTQVNTMNGKNTKLASAAYTKILKFNTYLGRIQPYLSTISQAMASIDSINGLISKYTEAPTAIYSLTITSSN